MKRPGWAMILLMDTPFVIYHGWTIGVPWRVGLLHWWSTSRAMWRYGE